MHFNKSFDEEFFKQITAEKIQTKYDKGHPKRVWVKTRARNEALDINVYNLAALSILNPNFKAIKENSIKSATKQPKKARVTKYKGFNNGWAK